MAKAKTAQQLLPEGCEFTEYRGTPLVAFGDDKYAPQFGEAKAVHIVALVDDHKLSNEVVRDTVVAFFKNGYKFKLEADTIVGAARALVAHLAEVAAKKEAA
tara:strand:+ start:4187 stop:4492 length:306 start_codon:yes stop_codon:yes gene_type:complete